MSFFGSLDRRRWVTALVTLALAFLCGHIMQTVLADQPTTATYETAPDAAPQMQSGEEPKALPLPPAATLIPILQRPPVLPDRVGKPYALKEKTSCTPKLMVDAAPAATLRVRLEAPCHKNTRVLVTQAGIAGWAMTDANGFLQLRLPALSVRPLIKVEIEDQTRLATAKVPHAAEFQHVAIQWVGQQALRINAYEFGAQKSQFGHVWSGAPKSPARAARGSGGFLTRLGDGAGESAEIYSFQAGQASTRGVVRLVVEAEVTKQNCGKEVRATALQSSPIGALSPTEVALAMPQCDRIGEIVRLQNLFQDMRLAGR